MRISRTALFARGLVFVAGMAVTPSAADAQTDYFNTDRGRPLHVQDATAIERYAFELQAAPVRWSRATDARVVWSIEPEIAYGVFARTQLEIGVPVFVTENFGNGTRAGLGALHVSVLHAFNVETLGLPAMALTVGAAVPAGKFGPRQLYPSIGAVLTRTMSLGRVHLNGDYTSGDRIADDDSRWESHQAAGLGELSRWTAGVAMDRAIPLRSMLVGAELIARQPMRENSEVEWEAGAGVRWQLSPYWAFDAGVGRSLGDDREWSLTIGAARSFGLVNLMPFGR